MNLLLIVEVLLKIANFVSNFISESQLSKANKSELIQEQLEVLNEKLKKVHQARDSLAANTSPDELLKDDGYKRD